MPPQPVTHVHRRQATRIPSQPQLGLPAEPGRHVSMLLWVQVARPVGRGDTFDVDRLAQRLRRRAAVLRDDGILEELFVEHLAGEISQRVNRLALQTAANRRRRAHATHAARGAPEPVLQPPEQARDVTPLSPVIGVQLVEHEVP